MSCFKWFIRCNLLLIIWKWFHVKLKFTIMNKADVFLCVGEKIDELILAGFKPFFHYSGHVNYFSVYIYKENDCKNLGRILDLDSYNFDNIGEWLQAFQNAANLLMLQKA